MSFNDAVMSLLLDAASSKSRPTSTSKPTKKKRTLFGRRHDSATSVTELAGKQASTSPTEISCVAPEGHAPSPRDSTEAAPGSRGGAMAHSRARGDQAPVQTDMPTASVAPSHPAPTLQLSDEGDCELLSVSPHADGARAVASNLSTLRPAETCSSDRKLAGRSSGDEPASGHHQADQVQGRDPAAITSGFSNLSLSSTDGITRNQCIAHLKLLECFYQLRRRIASMDGLFGIKIPATSDRGYRDRNERDQVEALRGEKRWAVYLYRAVGRFEKWRDVVAPVTTHMTTAISAPGGKLSKIFGSSSCDERLVLTSDNLPPVDILIVWHAYMLNPRCYLQDCIREGRMRLWNTEMPWQAISDVIDNLTFEYKPPQSAVASYYELGGTCWTNEDEHSSKLVECPDCRAEHLIEWTDCGDFGYLMGDRDSWLSHIKRWAESGRGYADKGFETTCRRCSSTINHETLAAGRFLDDVDLLMSEDIAMPGTLLGIKGSPTSGTFIASQMFYDNSIQFDMQLPNLLLKRLTGPYWRDSAARYLPTSMEAIRTRIMADLHDRAAMRKVHAPRSHLYYANTEERIFIRRMLSHYHSNPSPFGLDLVGAVVRQGSFISKMHSLDWLHSPALHNTVDRLVQRYERFFVILGSKPDQMAVPTLDIDLAWHTHQLKPWKYFVHSIHTTGRFVDHDDKVSELALSDAFAATAKTYQRLYKEPYAECTCWYCEAVREAVAPMYRSNPVSDGALRRLDEQQRESACAASSSSPAECGARNHISAHSACRPSYPAKSEYNRLAADAKTRLDGNAKAAVRDARAKRRPVPVGPSETYWSSAYGRTVRVAEFAPFRFGENQAGVGKEQGKGKGSSGKEEEGLDYRGYHSHLYAQDPGCFAVGVDGRSRCGVGTCGSVIAARGPADAAGCLGGGASCTGGAGCGGGGGGCGGGG